MNPKMYYIQNVSGSQLEVATVSLIMEKNAISADCFPEDKLNSSSEIKKFQNLKFIRLLTAEELEAVKVQAAEVVVPVVVTQTPDLVTEVLSTVEQPQSIQVAVRNIEIGLNQLKALLSGQSVQKIPAVTKSVVPAGESESASGHIVKAASAPSSEDDAEFFPDHPPKGMEPKNDPVKKFLGKSPYTVAFSYQEKMKFITSCGDPGMLREIAIFEGPGRVKDMAKKKLRETEAVAQI